MDELRLALKELSGKIPEIQRLVEEASEYPIHPTEIRVAAEMLTVFVREVNERSSELRKLLLSQTEGEIPPPSEESEWGRGSIFPDSPDTPGSAGSTARRVPPPLPRSPGGERLPEEALAPARNP